AAHRVGEHGAAIVRHVVNQHRAGPALRAVAAQLGSRQSQFVAQGPGQRLLLHHFYRARLAVHVQRDQPFAAEAPPASRRKNAVAGRADDCASGNYAENKTASRDRFRWGLGWLWTRFGMVGFRHRGPSGLNFAWDRLAGLRDSCFASCGDRAVASRRRRAALSDILSPSPRPCKTAAGGGAGDGETCFPGLRVQRLYCPRRDGRIWMSSGPVSYFPRFQRDSLPLSASSTGGGRNSGSAVTQREATLRETVSSA